MKYAVGYQLSEEYERDFIDIIKKYKDSISEIYFPWLDNATGRGALAERQGYFDWSVQNKLLADLRLIKSMGIRLDLLYNGNCYGDESMSVTLANRVLSIIDYVAGQNCAVDIVTTTSPFIAHVIKSNYPGIEVRASVNMRIGSVKGMQYLSHLFDSFYMLRDYNRDLSRIAELKRWADEHGKSLYIIANSGCMRECSCQTFHDNMVAHNSGIEKMHNLKGFEPHACWNYLKKKENWVSLLQNTWIRPEDIHHYAPYFETVKLATRMHNLPGLVIDSYIRERYYGNLLDLFEPGFGPIIAPFIIDNSRFPKDWFEKTSRCDKKCYSCAYCRKTLDSVLINSEEY